MRLNARLAIPLSLSLVSSAIAAPIIKPEFPRLGRTVVGSPKNYDDPVVQARLARVDFIIIDFHPTWGGGDTNKMRSAIQAIKKLNPKIAIVDYVILEQVDRTYPGVALLRAKADREHWWLYENGKDGARVTAGGTGTADMMNFTDAAKPDASGERWNTWFVKNVYATMWSFIPELDGSYTDNFEWKPRRDGDWNVDGKTDVASDPAIWPLFRRGMIKHVETMRTLMPGRIVIGNAGSWGRPEASTPEYTGKLDGGLLEHYIGQTWSMEGLDWTGTTHPWGSWSRMMGAYKKVDDQVGPWLMFNMMGKPSDYQTFRYGFASALMRDAFFDFSPSSSVYKPQVFWFDEYDLAGTGKTSWLGKAVDPPRDTPWEKGVYRRRFEHGVALVNPRGNGPQTVNLGPGFTRFKGSQDPAVNDGKPASVITLKDRDGVLLVATGAVIVPPPPTTIECAGGAVVKAMGLGTRVTCEPGASL